MFIFTFFGCPTTVVHIDKIIWDVFVLGPIIFLKVMLNIFTVYCLHDPNGGLNQVVAGHFAQISHICFNHMQ